MIYRLIQNACIFLTLVLSNTTFAGELEFSSGQSSIINNNFSTHSSNTFTKIGRLKYTFDRDFTDGDVISFQVTNAKFNHSSPISIYDDSGSIEFLEFDGNKLTLLIINTVETGFSFTFDGMEIKGGHLEHQEVVTLSTSIIICWTKVSEASLVIAEAVNNITSSIIEPFDGTMQYVKSQDPEVTRVLISGKNSADSLFIKSQVSTDAKKQTFLLSGNFSGFSNAEGGFLHSAEIEVFGDHCKFDYEDIALKVNDNYLTFTIDQGRHECTDGNGFQYFPQLVEIRIRKPENTTHTSEFYLTVDAVGYNEGEYINLINKVPAGKWKYQKTVHAKIPMMPVGKNYSQSISVTSNYYNEITADFIITANEQTYYIADAVTLLPNTVNELAKAFKLLNNSLGIDGLTSLDIIIDAPKDSITFNALYYDRATGDRAIIPVTLK